MWTRVWWSAACFAAILGFSRLAYGFLVPPMRAALGGGYALYGAIGSVNFIGYLAGTLAATRLARRPDRIALDAWALGTMCAAMAATGFVHDFVTLAVLRFVVGVASAVATVLTLALAVEGVPPQRRGLAAAVVWAGAAAGIALTGAGALAVPLDEPFAWRAQWVAMALLGVLAGAGFIRAVRARGPVAGAVAIEPDDGGAIGLFAPKRYLTLTAGYALYAFGAMDVLTFFTSQLRATHALPLGLGWTLLGVAGVAGARAWGSFLDRRPDGLPVAAAIACCAIGSFAALGDGAVVVAAGSLALGFALLGVPAMVGALLQQREPARRYARAFAGITAVFAVGQIAGPFAGGAVADRFGTLGAIALGAFALAAAAVLCGAYRVGARSADVPQNGDAEVLRDAKKSARWETAF